MEANAFTLARPRGKDLDIPAVRPRKTNTSRAPMDGPIRALDRNDAIKRGTSA
jgi:hypothetical protein